MESLGLECPDLERRITHVHVYSRTCTRVSALDERSAHDDRCKNFYQQVHEGGRLVYELEVREVVHRTCVRARARALIGYQPTVEPVVPVSAGFRSLVRRHREDMDGAIPALRTVLTHPATISRALPFI